MIGVRHVDAALDGVKSGIIMVTVYNFYHSRFVNSSISCNSDLFLSFIQNKEDVT